MKNLAYAPLLGILVGALPVIASYHLANNQALTSLESKASVYSLDLLKKTEQSAKELGKALKQLNMANLSTGEPHCSRNQIQLMQEISLQIPSLQTIGYRHGEELLCSAYGIHNPPIKLVSNLPTILSSTSNKLHPKVYLSLAPQQSFLLVENNGYVAIVNEAATLDIPLSPPETAIAIYSTSSNNYLAAKGALDIDWVSRRLEEGNVTFVDSNHVVSVRESKVYPLISIAAIPLSYLVQKQYDQYKVWLPFGVAVGIALFLLTFYLIQKQSSLPSMIRKGLKDDEFYLEYQPIMDLETNSCIGAEALLRWRRKDHSVIRPDIFIPAAEESNQILALTDCVLALVEKDATKFFKQFPDCHLAINLSSADLHSDKTPDKLKAILTRTSTKSHNFIVEATEHSLLDVDLTKVIIARIRDMGIDVAIDDFGTGYSSLSYLGSFPVDYIKIDKSFVDIIGTDAVTSHVILHIINIAHSLNLKMVAEGVETLSQQEFLKANGVQYAQGWLFSKSLPMPDLVRFIQNNKSQSKPL